SLFVPKRPVHAIRRVSYACVLSLRSRRLTGSRRSWAASSSGLNFCDCARASSPDPVRTTPDSALDRQHLFVTFALASDATTLPQNPFWAPRRDTVQHRLMGCSSIISDPAATADM